MTKSAVAAQSALLVVDIQNSFLPGGALAVPGGDEIVPQVNQLAQCFETVIITQDWHPAHHLSFASQHPGRSPFETIELDYGPQMLWPEHCIQGSEGAALASGLALDHARLILRKGTNPNLDSYSAFIEADRKTATGLAAWLRSQQIHHLYVVGLATDFCVAWSALDARAEGFRCTVIEDACRAIDINGSLATAWQAMMASGVEVLQSQQLLAEMPATADQR